MEKLTGTIDLGGGPEFAVADGAGDVYDNLEDQSLVLKIDAALAESEGALADSPLCFAFQHGHGPAESAVVSRLP